MPATKDPYKTLGVDKKASAEEIKKAYRKLARQYHPDRNPGDAAAEERFKEIQSAYDVVGDAEKRKQYDAGGGIFGGFDPAHSGRRLRRRRRAASAASATSCPTCSAGPVARRARPVAPVPRAPSAAATSRPRSTSRSSRRWRARRCR